MDLFIRIVGIGFLIPSLSCYSKVQRLHDTDSKIEDYPYAVAIYEYGKTFHDKNDSWIEKDWNFKCTGALITRQIVITGASCVPKNWNYYGVNLGHAELNRYNNWANVANKRIHPLYEKGLIDYNVALLKLGKAFTNFQPIKICYKSDWEYWLADGYPKSGTVVGWGLKPPTDPESFFRPRTHLQNVTYDIVERRACIKGLHLRKAKKLPMLSLCTGFCIIKQENAPEPEDCISEVGALFVVDGNLYGIASITPRGCARTNMYYYTKFTHYGLAHWIEATKKELATRML